MLWDGYAESFVVRLILSWHLFVIIQIPFTTINCNNKLYSIIIVIIIIFIIISRSTFIETKRVAIRQQTRFKTSEAKQSILQTLQNSSASKSPVKKQN